MSASIFELPAAARPTHIWHLVARTPEGMRTYRVSRMSNAIALTVPFKLPIRFNLVRYWRACTARLDQQRRCFAATLALTPEAAASLRQWSPVSPNPNASRAATIPSGWVILDVTFESFSHALFFALGFGPSTYVLAPAELSNRVKGDLEKAMKLYAQFSLRDP